MEVGKSKKNYKIKEDTIKKLTLYLKKDELQFNQRQKTTLQK